MRKIKTAVKIFQLSFLVLASLALFGGGLLPIPQAHASGEQYLVYYPKNKQEAIGNVIKHNIGLRVKKNDGAMNDMIVYGVNGVWGNTANRLTYNKTASDELEDDREVAGARDQTYVFTQEYFCVDGADNYDVAINALVEFPKDGDLSDTDKFQSLVAVSKYWKNKPTTESPTKDTRNEYLLDDELDGLPEKCRPGQNLDPVNIDNYYKLTCQRQEAWRETGASLEVDRQCGSGGGDTPDNPDCDAKLSSPLSWIICPLVDLGTYLTDYIFKEFVRPFLEEVPVSTDSNDGVYKTWEQFRTLGNILLIGTLLMIVYSQARGGGGR